MGQKKHNPNVLFEKEKSVNAVNCEMMETNVHPFKIQNKDCRQIQ